MSGRGLPLTGRITVEHSDRLTINPDGTDLTVVIEDNGWRGVWWCVYDAQGERVVTATHYSERTEGYPRGLCEAMSEAAAALARLAEGDAA